jgi:hypothetical protein
MDFVFSALLGCRKFSICQLMTRDIRLRLSYKLNIIFSAVRTQVHSLAIFRGLTELMMEAQFS